MQNYKMNPKPAPWKCGPCKRMVKGIDEFCPMCYGHWATVQEQAGQGGGGWNWDRWNAQQTRAPNPPKPPKPKRPSRSQSEKQKGKDASKGTGAEGLELPAFPQPFQNLGPSPFGGASSSYAGANVASSPWMPADRPETSMANAELLSAIRKAFPKQEDMPDHLREVMNRTSASVGRHLTTELHRAAATLGKARKTMTQVIEAQRVHKARWMQHVSESIDSWRAQLQAFKAQQTQFQASLSQAQKDVESARATIQRLNQEAAGTLAMPQEVSDLLETTPTCLPPNPEEAKLRAQMQEQLQAAFEVLGEVPQGAEGVLGDTTVPPANKRHRSSSPDREAPGNGQEEVPAPVATTAVASPLLGNDGP